MVKSVFSPFSYHCRWSICVATYVGETFFRCVPSLGRTFLFSEDGCCVDIRHGKAIKKISLLLAILLLFSAVLIGCESRSQKRDNPSVVIPPSYEKQFDDVSYEECIYILNKNTLKFHYKDCYTIDQMSQRNKVYCDDNRESIIKHNYAPCKKCNP